MSPTQLRLSRKLAILILSTSYFLFLKLSIIIKFDKEQIKSTVNATQCFVQLYFSVLNNEWMNSSISARHSAELEHFFESLSLGSDDVENWRGNAYGEVAMGIWIQDFFIFERETYLEYLDTYKMRGKSI